MPETAIKGGKSGAKQCPHCGYYPNVYPPQPAIGNDAFVACFAVGDACDVRPATKLFGTVREAVKAWNRGEAE